VPVVDALIGEEDLLFHVFLVEDLLHHLLLHLLLLPVAAVLLGQLLLLLQLLLQLQLLGRRQYLAGHIFDTHLLRELELVDLLHEVVHLFGLDVAAVVQDV